MNILFVILIILAGMGLSFEAGILGPLGSQVGKLWATMSIVSVGALVLWLVDYFTPQQKQYKWEEIPRWQLIGGILGSLYVVVLTLSTPVISVAMTMVCVLFGQITKSFAIDYFGWFGVARKPTNPMRVIGLIFVLIALCFSYLGAIL
ncbi:DMT family transporter [Photobacterium sp. SDRW27]|uniref:DMT family transporter n=1 Tax=Photobacterium obscurum TaxID=2829490 RepID=UPI00224389DD|nr:DMT family transporter [Photobacterium obscurum]MCW8327839.1 DMT family transporter [Photobacterium obscurum]